MADLSFSWSSTTSYGEWLGGEECRERTFYAAAGDAAGSDALGTCTEGCVTNSSNPHTDGLFRTPDDSFKVLIRSVSSLSTEKLMCGFEKALKLPISGSGAENSYVAHRTNFVFDNEHQRGPRPLPVLGDSRCRHT
jgi:hypothetical protein